MSEKKEWKQSCNIDLYRTQYDTLVKIGRKAEMPYVVLVRKAIDDMLRRPEKEIIQEAKREARTVTKSKESR